MRRVIATAQLTDRLEATVREVFGEDDDPMFLVEHRAQKLLGEYRPIVWEGDPETFEFAYVGGSAEKVLGYPVRRWIDEQGFWADTVVHPEDRNDAIAFCALATGRGADHDFQYRARAADGRIVRLHDIVKVIKSAKGIPRALRGIMIEMPEDATPR